LLSALLERVRRNVADYSDGSSERVESHIKARAKELPFWQWCLEAKLWIDREEFTYDGFSYLKPIYESVPFDQDELRNFDLTVMKAAQMGGSVIMILLQIYILLRFAVTGGYYFPDQTTALDFSAIRFLKMVRSNPDLLSLMRDVHGFTDEGSKSVRRIGDSTLLFLYTGMNLGPGTSRTTMRTESMPLDILVFDEVQGMTRSQMEKTQERVSASFLKVIGRVSTAKWPGADIDEWFQAGDQRYWHTDCSSRCSDGIILSEEWPNCVGDSNGKLFYRCPHCDTEIRDPQKGRYIAHNPKSEAESFHFAQTIARRVTIREMWNAWLNNKDRQNFNNRKLGKPYADPSEIPISIELLKQKAFNPDITWSVLPGDCYMGIDHMGALNVIVIKRRMQTGRDRVVHLEWVEDLDPFKRSAELMEQFKIRFCALENEPNYNEAFRFAKAFPGRVFIIEYTQGAISGEFLRWLDRDKTEPGAIRKTSDEARAKYAVRVDQYKMMSYSMLRIKDGMMEMPNPATRPLIRERIIAGRMTPDNIGELFAAHLTKVALRSEKDEKLDRYQNYVQKIGSDDPHFTYANMCCDVAVARAYGTTRFLTGEMDREEAEAAAEHHEDSAAMQQIKARLPIVKPITREVCGVCANFTPKPNGKDGICEGIQFNGNVVQREDIRCEEFSPLNRA